MPYSYKKGQRLRKNSEFISAMKAKRLSVDGLSLFYAPNGMRDFRVGISVGKKIGNAVLRNKLKRRLRSCISRVLGEQAAGYDLVFVARAGLADMEYGEILHAVEKAIQRLNLSHKRAG